MAKSNKKGSFDISYEIEKEYGYLNDKQSKIVAKVAWNGKEAKIDIRSCFTKDGGIKLGKGISLSDDEVAKLKSILEKLSDDDNDKDDQSSKKKAVNFEEIFGQATGIVERREQGFTTKDGFIQLKPRHGIKI